MQLKMSRILVTGGAGYIGSHFCKMASLKGHTIGVIDNLSTGNKWALRWGTFYKGDLRNLNEIESAIKDFNPEYVVHFAGSSLVGESILYPEKYMDNNVYATCNLIEAMYKYSIRNIIFSSSCAVYGQPETLPITEETFKNPINPYGQSKLDVENFIRESHEKYGIHYTILRYFNVAGCDPESEIGEYHHPETHIIPNTLSSIFNEEAIYLYGTNYNTPDGTCLRDYVHVFDICRAHLLAVDQMGQSRIKSEVINIGSGKPHSVKEIIRCAERITGKKALIEYRSNRVGDPPILYASNERALSVLGWEPEQSSIDDIIRDAWKWEEIKDHKIKQYKHKLS